MPKQYDNFSFFGGLDINSPYLNRTPGSLLGVLNYEPDPDGGIRYMEGYERFDGMPSPTDVRVLAIPVDSVFSPEPTLGDAVTGDTSSATGQYVDQDATLGYVFVMNSTGTFDSSETLNGTSVTTTGISYQASSVIDGDMALTLYQTAREYNRGNISEVPGSGPVRAVYELDNEVFAIRDNVGATAANIYKATTTGWSLVDLSDQFLLRFDNGTAGSVDPFAIEQTVTGFTSGATGVVTGVANQSADRQAGYITLKNVVGTFTDGEDILVSAVKQAEVNGPQEAITIANGGSYQISSFNFFGFTSTNSMYITNGQQFGFQFDGEAVAPIETPSELSFPEKVAIHQNHLFFSFAGGNLVHSVIGEPLNFRADFGAVQFALGANVTNLIVSPQSLIITTVTDVQALYGANTDDWNLANVSKKSLGIENSGQYLIQPLVVDSAGLISLSKVDAFGDYQDAMVSDKIRRLIIELSKNVVTSGVDRAKNQYYLFTSTGDNIMASFSNNQFIGYYQFNFDRSVLFFSSNEDRLFFTDDTGGFVYQWQKGTSHDGAVRKAFIQTSYAFQGQPQRKKRYRRVTISLKAFVAVDLRIAFSFSKGSASVAESSFTGSAIGGGGRWDIGLWNQMLWDSQDVPEIFSDIDGVGTDISMFLFSESSEVPSFVLEDIIIEYSPRSLKR